MNKLFGILLATAVGISVITFIVSNYLTQKSKPIDLNTSASQSIAGEPLVGVRHFPGYPSNNHQVRNAQEQLLASGSLLEKKQDWSDRWPYYTVIRSFDAIDIHEDDQAIIDQEIQLTAASGIDYWAIEADWIEQESGYNYALNLYNASKNKNLLKFSLIVTAETLSSPDWKGNYLNNISHALKDSQYVRVARGRPLLYVWRLDALVTNLGEIRAKKRMAEFKTELKSVTGKEPYIVVMDLGSRNILSKAKDFSADARTSYLGEFMSCGRGGPYANLAQDNLKQWNSFVNSDLNYIPLVTVGMDPRPKSLDKELFEFGDDPIWCKQGTPNEIANNVKEAVNWVKSHRQATSEANSVLIAAWMDITESGWLVPTTKEGNARLNAISKVLGGKIMDVPASPFKTSVPARHAKGEITELSLSDGAQVKAGIPFRVSGIAPMAARLKFSIYGNKVHVEKIVINGKGTFQTRKFDVELPALPAGGPYTLTIQGVTEDPIFNDIKFVRVSDITAK